MSAKLKLYIGCALTHSSPEYIAAVDRTKDALRSEWDVMEFVGVTAGTDKDVFMVDVIQNVRGCDAFIGICDEVSLGLGWEFSEAANLGKPMLAAAHADSKISRLITGARYYYPNMEFVRYGDMVADIPKFAANILLPKLDKTNEISNYK